MSKFTNKTVLLLSTLALSIVVVVLFTSEKEPTPYTLPLEVESLEEKARTNEGRAEFFFQLQRDPVTNSIPTNVRAREVEFASSMPSSNDINFKSNLQVNVTEIGPNDVGGRTRALAVDVNNSNIILAGGVAGGMWKSTDAGQTWTQRTTPAQHHSVSFIAQDPRPGNTNTWYYTTGEFSGNSARDRGGSASYNGHGIFKSTDNGDTWAQIASTILLNDLNSFDSEFDFMHKIVVSPVTGTVLASGNFTGVYRSTDGENFSGVLGNTSNDHEWAEVAVAGNGNFFAVLSETGNTGAQNQAPGVYMSTNDGVSWTNITPAIMPSTHDRSRIAIAPSNNDMIYIFVEVDPGSNPGLVFINLADRNQDADRSSNIPNFGGSVGDLNLQGGYNMTIAVHPTNPDLVIMGGINLFRSFDGFSTPSSNPGTNTAGRDSIWVAGYNQLNNVSLYPNHHPDNHVLFFDPNNPGRLYSGHDGGLAVTNDVTSGAEVVWTSLNNGYNVTQFYTAALSRTAGDDRVIGGTQDNGSPFFRFNSATPISPTSEDVSSGDGAYAAIGQTFVYTSSQRGNTLRLTADPQTGTVVSPFTSGGTWTRVQPAGAIGELFIHPFAIDPVSDRIMYYPATDNANNGVTQFIWRNSRVDQIPNFQNGDQSLNWEALTNVNLGANSNGMIISTITAAATPRFRIYYGGSATSGNQAPRIFRFDNSTIATDGEVDISIPGAPAGAYIHDIAVNEKNGDEIIAILSNYNVTSIYYSDDAGANWTDIEGNLGDSQNFEGPSVRTAGILEVDANNKIFLVGTSIGLYSTQTLDGSNTVWTQESADALGLSVVEYIDIRPQDNTIAIATHSRGIFVGEVQMSVSTEDDEELTPTSFELEQNFPNPFNPTTNIRFTLSQPSQVSLSVFDISGRKVADILSSESRASGTFQVTFDASALASGTYVYRLEAAPNAGGASLVQTRTMTLIK